MSSQSLFLKSKLLSQGPFVAGFSTRFGSVDLHRLARVAGFTAEQLYFVTQVHGNTVLSLSGQESRPVIAASQADAMVTLTPGVALAVQTADCVPILLTVDGGGDRQGVAAVHAGWRGVVAGVVSAAVATLLKQTATCPSVLKAAVGPAIDQCCFEVGEEVANTITSCLDDFVGMVKDNKGRRPYIDLREAAVRSLISAGVAKDRIERVGPCTRCAASLFHSYRREGPGKGRQYSFVYFIRGISMGKQRATGSEKV